MNITLQISDAAYQRLVSTGSRIQGTIGLINPMEGNFSEHRKGQAKPGTRSIKLRHGWKVIFRNTRKAFQSRAHGASSCATEGLRWATRRYA